ncbi:MAG: hypothetical protein FWE13_02835 [Firmicutes bacterium]|nr:hypothetical protein [Bacillota bacterium]
MDNKQLFKKYHRRLMVEGIIQALLCGIAVGLALAIIPAVIALFYNVSGVVMALIVLAGGIVVATPIFYFVFFRPTIDIVAHRVDRLGLEERVITMMEFQDDNSYLVKVQREDAKKCLSNTSSKKLKISKYAIAPLAIVLSVMLVISVPLAWGSDAAVDGRWIWRARNFEERITQVPPDIDTEFVSLNFSVRLLDQQSMSFSYDVGGHIEGYSNQIIQQGGNATGVTAVADTNFSFLMWSDAQPHPSWFQDEDFRDFWEGATEEDRLQVMMQVHLENREGRIAEMPWPLPPHPQWPRPSLVISEDTNIFAIFIQLGDGENNDEDDDGDGDPGDDETESEPGDDDGEGEDAIEPEPGDDNGNDEGPGPPDPGDDDGSGGGSGDYENNPNRGEDGERPFYQVVQEMYLQARTILAAGGTLPPSLVAFAALHFPHLL